MTWTDVLPFLVTSDGTRSLGNNEDPFNSTRDEGSKIVFFDVEDGDNDTAVVYWWNGSAIVDSTGATSGVGGAYGTDPLNPNLAAIKPFEHFIGAAGNAVSDNRLRSHNQDFGCVAAGYPDWFLFRRGQTHTEFDGFLDGGRSEDEPMVIASYGPATETRAVIDPNLGGTVVYDGDTRGIEHPFAAGTSGDDTVWEHQVMLSLDIKRDVRHLGTHTGTSLTPGGGPLTCLIEDCRLINASLTYLPSSSTVRRSVVAFRWDADEHNQGYYTEGFVCETTFEDCCFYKNGYKENPRTVPDPKRDIFSRNVYEGGGAQMGHTFLNTLIVDGASGGPQMRLGGLIERCLIIEGYWFSYTNSNEAINPWLTAGPQVGQSAHVKNNVQQVFIYPSVEDPDGTGLSDVAAQPGSGYSCQGATFGAVFEGNLISCAMLVDELGEAEFSAAACFAIIPAYEEYQDMNSYTIQNNEFRNNIGYRVNTGFTVAANWDTAAGMVVEDNVFACDTPIRDFSSNLSSNTQLLVQNNRFYGDVALPVEPWMGAGNTLDDFADAETEEEWPDPDRTLKRYVTEVLGLTLLDWADDPFVTAGDQSTTDYDPMGTKTFMAVVTNMRLGAATPAPSSGKPSWTGDYAWDSRYTAEVVNDWIRAGFGLAPVAPEQPVVASGPPIGSGLLLGVGR